MAADAPVPTITIMKKGDVDGDGVVDVADLTLVANEILGKKPSLFIRQAADLDDDDIIDVADFVRSANIILQKGK